MKKCIFYGISNPNISSTDVGGSIYSEKVDHIKIEDLNFTYISGFRDSLTFFLIDEGHNSEILIQKSHFQFLSNQNIINFQSQGRLLKLEFLIFTHTLISQSNYVVESNLDGIFGNQILVGTNCTNVIERFFKESVDFFIAQSIIINDDNNSSESESIPFSVSSSTEGIIVTICLKLPLLVWLIYMIYLIAPKNESKAANTQTANSQTSNVESANSQPQNSQLGPYGISSSLIEEEKPRILPTVTVTTLESSDDSSSH